MVQRFTMAETWRQWGGYKPCRFGGFDLLLDQRILESAIAQCHRRLSRKPPRWPICRRSPVAEPHHNTGKSIALPALLSAPKELSTDIRARDGLSHRVAVKHDLRVSLVWTLHLQPLSVCLHASDRRVLSRGWPESVASIGRYLSFEHRLDETWYRRL